MTKRAVDVGLAGVGLVLSWPLWVLVAIAIWLEDRGPVFFRQGRVGRHGRVFETLKFRSMIPEAEVRWGPLQAGPDDPRVTAVGSVLRATALDELPQLWNILTGDMSFVGPRPLRPGEIVRRGDGRVVQLADVPGYVERHAIRPGLTGLAQIYAPRDISPLSKFRLDRLYARRSSAWLDIKLVLMSLWISLRGDWEARHRRRANRRSKSDTSFRPRRAA